MWELLLVSLFDHTQTKVYGSPDPTGGAADSAVMKSRPLPHIVGAMLTSKNYGCHRFGYMWRFGYTVKRRWKSLSASFKAVQLQVKVEGISSDLVVPGYKY